MALVERTVEDNIQVHGEFKSLHIREDRQIADECRNPSDCGSGLDGRGKSCLGRTPRSGKAISIKYLKREL